VARGREGAGELGRKGGDLLFFVQVESCNQII
jgi:hypothetical protein